MNLFKKAQEQIENTDKLTAITTEKAYNIIKALGGEDVLKDKLKMMDNYIVFTSPAGGTGASTLVSNLAFKMQKAGFKVLVVDLDIKDPMHHVFLNIKQELKDQTDLVSYLKGETTLAESIKTTKDYDLLFANGRTIVDSIYCHSETSVKNFSEMMHKLRSLYDIILVDCPNDIENELYNTALYDCDTIYAVWDEGISSVLSTTSMRDNLLRTCVDSFTKMRIILNKRTHIHYTNYPFKKMNTELIGILPFDTSIIESSHQGQIYCKSGASNSKNAIAFDRTLTEIADSIVKDAGYMGK